MKTIEFNLSVGSIDAAIKELEKYKESISSKTELLAKELCEKGIPEIERCAESTVSDDENLDRNVRTNVDVKRSSSRVEATLTAQSWDLAFIEFGAGVHYNGHLGSSPNPKGDELGMTIGSFGQGHGQLDSWEYRIGPNQMAETHGTKASMPMYNASIIMRSIIGKTAKEVFGAN